MNKFFPLLFQHAETKCRKVILELNNPSFENNTLPKNWLSRMRSNIYQLSITGGNLNHISPNAFISQFTGSIKILLLQDLYLTTWESNSLVGLSSLEALNIVKCEIGSFQVDSIRAIDDTVQILTITESGYWNPVNVTGLKGFEKLTIVNFSNNDFNNILDEDSFVGLEHCKILYLNSCGIVSIGAGAFDSLKSIEVIYMDFNLLVTVPPGLFDTILLLDNPRPRISLQENFWHCDCDMEDLRQLVRKDILLVDGICTYPSSMNGQTFTQLEDSCFNEPKDKYENETFVKIEAGTVDAYAGLKDNKVYINGTCRITEDGKSAYRTKWMFNLVSPQENNKCSLDRSNVIDVSSLTSTLANIGSPKSNYRLKLSFLLKTAKFNTIQLEGAETNDYGLLWFQSDCPIELYCIDFIPTFLRIYNVDDNTRFTFCPMKLSTGEIANDACIGYATDDVATIHEYYRVLNWLLWSTTAVLCICFGAIFVYGLIRMNPILLKGSKRILFVKHKTVDALILPPKVPLRNGLVNDTTLDKEIFTLCANDNLMFPKMGTIKSVTSNKSSSPSYISALHPSEDQLAEWRISRHFNNDLTISSKSELSTSSWICDTSYYSLDESDRTYESLK